MTKLMVTFLIFANGRKKLKVHFVPLILNFRKSIVILEIPRLRLFVLLIGQHAFEDEYRAFMERY